MKKSMLTLAFSIVCMNASLAHELDGSVPLTHRMGENMTKQALTYIETIGKNFQLHATDLYTMGQALLNQKDDAKSQALGKETIRYATQMHQLAKEMYAKEVTPEQMEIYIKKCLEH